MKIGKIYFDFEILKEMFNIPKDALLKNIHTNNESGEVEISFYTNLDGFNEVAKGNYEIEKMILDINALSNK